MSTNSFTIPESLKNRLKNKQVIPFVGAGVSRAVQKKAKDVNKETNPDFCFCKQFANK